MDHLHKFDRDADLTPCHKGKSRKCGFHFFTHVNSCKTEFLLSFALKIGNDLSEKVYCSVDPEQSGID